MESKVSISSVETASTIETFHVRSEKLEKQASSVALALARMEDQLKSFEVMQSKLDFLEKEVKLLGTDPMRQIPKDFNPYQLKDEDIPLEDLWLIEMP
ncbi:unnamed protein product [Arabis nemorensis]|uniref:Uncharacterized protein n=1 Tax=Arabis nemorensis TaxID=586526 RepID=A0A565BH97_9BRAS|nr:unnamed protein product [Arabis nemorensis]